MANGHKGDPGSYEAIVSLEDDIVATHAPRIWRWLLAAAGTRRPSRLATGVIRKAQRRAERLHSRMRRDLLRYDDQLESTLAFSGRTE